MLYMFLLYKDPTLAEPSDVMEQHAAVETKAKQRGAYVARRGWSSAPPRETSGCAMGSRS